VEEVEALLREQEQVVGVQVLCHRRANEDAQVDAIVAVPNLVVRPGAERGDVGAHPHRLGEVDFRQALAGGLRPLHRHVGDDLPVFRHGGMPGVEAFQVRLVEGGEDPLRVRRLELAVQVGLAVHRVHGAV